MSQGNNKRIEHVFLRETTLGLAKVGLVATLATWATCYSALDRQMGRLLEEKARLVTAALSPDREGNWTPAISHLLRDFPEVQAIGRIGPRYKGQIPHLQALYPNTSNNDRAARAILKAEGGVASTSVPTASGSAYLWGAVASLPPGSPSETREVLILFAVESIFVAALWQSVFCGVVMLVMVLLASTALARWFKREVLRPLRTLAPPGDGSDALAASVPMFDTRQWPELERVAEALRTFRRNAIQNNNKRLTAQRLADERIRDHRHGFDQKLRRAEDKATTDALTGLRNRAFLDGEFEPLALDCLNRCEDLSLVMFDVDNFKTHNDTLGHAAGDNVLRFMGELLSAAVRPDDHAARFGGDEFILLLPRTSAKDAMLVAQRIVKLFRQHVQSLEGESTVSLSAGVASIRASHTTDPAELMECADAALYFAKVEGKNEAFLYQPQTQSQPTPAHRKSACS